MGIRLEEGVFAVAEWAKMKNETQDRQELTILHPIEKVAGTDHEGKLLLDNDGSIKERSFILADTNTFSDPCCAVPDIGGPAN